MKTLLIAVLLYYMSFVSFFIYKYISLSKTHGQTWARDYLTEKYLKYGIFADFIAYLTLSVYLWSVYVAT